MYRAYHALPGLTTADGTLVNAVYGFFSMLLTVLQEQQPTHLIISFDVSKPTYRQSLFAGYHENRPQMAAEFAAQFAMVHDILHAGKLAVAELAGAEADDVIGTLAHQLKNKAKQTLILTGDRDLLQLVDKTTFVMMPVVGVKNTILFDEAAVKEKYGVLPSQFVDYKALIGDASDNYPGVSGIGPKTAAHLLNTYGTFEDLYKNIAAIPEKYALKLAHDAEQAALAKKLATILTDVSFHMDFSHAALLQLDTKGLLAEFEKYHFVTLAKRFSPFLKKIEEQQKGEQLGLL